MTRASLKQGGHIYSPNFFILNYVLLYSIKVYIMSLIGHEYKWHNLNSYTRMKWRQRQTIDARSVYLEP